MSEDNSNIEDATIVEDAINTSSDSTSKDETVNSITNSNTDELTTKVADSIKYTMLKDVLIKPLESIMVTKQFEVPVVKDDTKPNEDGSLDYNKTELQTKEVESNFRSGIILKLPENLGDVKLVVGQTVVYPRKFAIDFDLLKDSKLVKAYDIVAIIPD